MIFSNPPRYTMLPCPQDRHIEDGRIVAWTLRVMMTSGPFVNVSEEEYTCQVGEVRVEGDNLGGFLEQILKKVDDERDFLNRCADELEQKMKLAQVASEPLNTPAV